MDVRHGQRRQQVLVDAAAAQELIVRPVAEEMRRDGRTGEGGEDEKDDESGACERELVPTESQPDALPVTASTDRGLIAGGRTYLCLRNEVFGVDDACEAGVFLGRARH